MLTHDEIMALSATGEARWGVQEAMLYALGAGMGADPMDEQELPFVYEKLGEVKVLPTFPVVVGFHGGALKQVGVNYQMVLHGEQAVTLHRPFPASGRVTERSRILGAWDKGAGKGAVVTQEKVLTLEGESEPLATLLTTTFARGDGGYGGPSEGQPEPHTVPTRAPDKTVEIATTPNQALIYRLSGDDNPLHADPAAARAAGFDRPILHGLCTYAICCRAVLAAYCDYDPTLIRHHQVRFSAPVLPGDTITVDLWRDGDEVSFEAHVRARGVTVIRNGLTRLGAA